jgi:VanZ family protein
MQKFKKYIPAILWMILIFYMSSRPTDVIVLPSTQRFLFFKSLHLIEYAILFIFVQFAIKKNSLSMAISYFYAITDEFHQSFIPGRSGQFSDTLIDLIGILIGLIILKIFRHRR